MKINLKFIMFLMLVTSIMIIPILVFIFSRSDIIITNGTGLEKSDWLSFGGAFLSFLGTITLGLIALWENQTLYKANERLVELNTVAQFYPEIEPTHLYINKKILDNPLQTIFLTGTEYSQTLVEKDETETDKLLGLWHIRLLFKKVRSFAPTSFNIESCSIYLDNKDGETQKLITGYCASKEGNKYFKLANKTQDEIKDSVIMSAYLAFREDENKTFLQFVNAKRLNMQLKFKYNNSFNVETRSSIRITWAESKNYKEQKVFITTDYYIYDNEHYLNSK